MFPLQGMRDFKIVATGFVCGAVPFIVSIIGLHIPWMKWLNTAYLFTRWMTGI